MARGNRKILYGVNNRGNKLDYAWRTILRAPTPQRNNNNPLTAADFGDGLLLRLGYMYVDAGWQGNVAPGNDRLVPNLPVATEPDGRPIVGRVRVEYADAEGFTRPLEGARRVSRLRDGGPRHGPFDVDGSRRVGGARVPVPSDRWAFGRCQTGRRVWCRRRPTSASSTASRAIGFTSWSIRRRTRS